MFTTKGETKKTIVQKKNAVAGMLIVALLFPPSVLAQQAITLSNVRFVAHSATIDAASTSIDVELALSNPPSLGTMVHLTCIVRSELKASNIEVKVELPEGFALVNGKLSRLTDIPANGKVEVKSLIRAVRIGDWTIHAQVRSGEHSLLQDVADLHVFVMEDVAYIGVPPGNPLCERLEHPPIVDVPLSSDHGVVPEVPQPFTRAPSSPGTLTVTGRFWCNISQDSLSGHTSDILQPVCWGGVSIFRANDLLHLGGDITGPRIDLPGEGYFSIPIENPGSAGFFVALVPRTSAACVVKPDDSEYAGYTPYYYPNASQTTYDIGEWTQPVRWDYTAAWRIYETIAQDHYDRGAYDFIASEGPGYIPPQVKVRFKMPDRTGTYINLSQGIIYIDTEAYSKALDVVQHEYGHWVMYNAYGGYWPSGILKNHSISQISNAPTAWTEGWANAFPLIVQSYGRWEDEFFEWGTGVSYDLENCPDSDPGDQCEGRVAGALWDVFDSHSDGYDTFQDGFLNIWNVLFSQTDDNYQQFFSAWYAKGRDRHQLNFCSYQNEINYDVFPDITDGYVNPSSGYIDTMFTFYVRYQDYDWDPAETIMLYVYDGGWKNYTMNHYSGDPASGEWFSRRLDGFSPGDHSFCFYASDGLPGGDDRDPSTGYYSFDVEQNTHLQTWISFNFMRNPTTPGSNASLQGIIICNQSRPISFADVEVEYSTDHGANWHYALTLTANYNGIFSKAFSAPGVGTYLVRASYAGNSTSMPCSNNAYLVVRSSLSLTFVENTGFIFFNFIPDPATPGSFGTLRGILLDSLDQPIASATVTVEYSTDHGSTWPSSGTLTTNQYGIFSRSFMAPATGTYLVRMNYGSSSITAYLVTISP